MRKFLFFVFFVSFSGCGMAETNEIFLLIEQGTASFYGKRFHGKKTSSGELFHIDSLTAAHKTLPFGTMVKVTRPDNGKSVLVRINDRLPFYSKRTIDLSRKAAEELEMIQLGLVNVDIEVTSDEMDRLIDYFEEKEDPGLRLRPLHQPIRFKKIKMKWPLASLQEEELKPVF